MLRDSCSSSYKKSHKYRFKKHFEVSINLSVLLEHTQEGWSIWKVAKIARLTAEYTTWNIDLNVTIITTTTLLQINVNGFQ